MDKRSSLAFRILLIAIGLGIVGDICLEMRPWGIGLPIFAVILATACFLIRRISGHAIAKSTAWVAVGLIPVAMLFAWRDADGLRVLNGFILLLGVGLVALRANTGAIYATNLNQLLVRGPFQWIKFISHGFVLGGQDVKWKLVGARYTSPRFASVGRGMLLAVVPVAIFVALLANADEVFNRIITPNISVDGESLLIHLSVWTTASILSAGFLRRLFLVTPEGAVPPVASASGTRGSIGITEVSTVLIALNSVLAIFVAIQFRYLFGGSSLVLATKGLTYSIYARKGFYELLTVVAISIPLLLGLNHLLKTNNLRDQKIFRCTAGLFIVQLFVVAASALDRMKLYVDFYSLSPLRFYAVAGMAFLIGVLGLFLGTTLRGRTELFAFNALVWLAVVVIGLNVINPDAVIAKYNLQNRPGYKVDVGLLASLSADATPAIVNGMHGLRDDQRIQLLTALKDRYQEARPWSTQTVSYHRSMRLVGQASH